MDEDKVEASFNNGVLKVSLPKRPEAIGKQRTIPMKKGEAEKSVAPSCYQGSQSRLLSCEGAHAVDVSASCARPFKANVLMKSVSRATKASSIFRLNGGCANCSRLRTNTLH